MESYKVPVRKSTDHDVVFRFIDSTSRQRALTETLEKMPGYVQAGPVTVIKEDKKK